MPIEEKKVVPPEGEQLELEGLDEQQEEQHHEDVPQVSEEEQRALSGGWIPLDQWKGDPKDHRSAREFNDRGELLGKLKTQGAQIREMSEMLRHLSIHNQKVYEAGARETLQRLQAAKVEAMREGDVDAAIQLDQRIDQQKGTINTIQAAQAQIAKPAGPSEAFQGWVGKNQWFTQDPSMRFWAIGMANEYGRINPTASEEEVYQFLDGEVRKEFPHKFRRTGAPSPDGPGRNNNNAGARGTGTDEFEKLLSTFPEDEARAARSLVRNKVVTKEKYISDYKQVNK